MATKLYFRATTNDQSGTYPSGEQQSTRTPDFSATGATTLRKLSTTKGSSQTSLAGNSAGTTASQWGYFGSWTTAPLAAQTIDWTNDFSWFFGNAESSTNMNFGAAGSPNIEAYVWRPSTGAKVGTAGWTGANPSGVAEPGAAASERVNGGSYAGNTGTTTVEAGDVIIIEVWFNFTQSMNSSYTGTYYFDGTTESTTVNATTSDIAAYIEFQQTLTFQGSSHNLTGNNAQTTPSSTTGAISQTHVLGGNNAQTTPSSTTGAISLGVPLMRVEQAGARVVSITSAQLRVEQAGARVVSQTSAQLRVEQAGARVVSTVAETTSLTGNSVQQPNTSTTGAFSQTHAVTGNSVNEPNSSTTGAISQTHVLAGNSANEPNSSTAAAISQTHVLTGANAQTTPSSSTGAITTPQTLTGNNVQQVNRCKIYKVVNPVKYDPSASGPSSYYALQNSDTRFFKQTADAWRHGICLYGKTLGKWYAEVEIIDRGNNVGIMVGISPSTWNNLNNAGDGGMLGYFADGQKRKDGTYSAFGASFTTGDVIGVLLDLSSATRTLKFYKNGVLQGTAFSGSELPANTNWKLTVSGYYINSTVDVRQHTDFALSPLPTDFQPWKASADAHTLTGNSVNQPNSTTTGSVVLPTALTGNNVNQPNTSTTGAVGSSGDVSGNNVQQPNSTTTGAISQTHVLTGANAKTTPSSTTGAVSSAHTLTGANCSTTPASTTGAISQTHVLTGANAKTTPTSSAGAVTSSGSLTGNNVQQPNASTSAAISQTHLLTGANAKTTPTSSTGNVVHIHALTGANAKTTPSCTNGSISTSGDLTGNNVRQLNTSSTGAVSSSHTLTGNNAKTTPASSTGAVTQTHLLAGNNAQQVNRSTSGNVVSIHTLTGNNAKTTPGSTAGAISTAHNLTGANAQQANRSTSAQVTMLHTVSGNDCVSRNTCIGGAVYEFRSPPNIKRQGIATREERQVDVQVESRQLAVRAEG